MCNKLSGIIFLFLGLLIKIDAHSPKLEPYNLPIQLQGYIEHVVFQFSFIFDKILHTESITEKDISLTSAGVPPVHTRLAASTSSPTRITNMPRAPIVPSAAWHILYVRFVSYIFTAGFRRTFC